MANGRWRWVEATVATLCLSAPSLWAQGGGAGGVYLDPDKVLRWTDSAKGKNAAKLQRLRGAKGKTTESGDLAYVSLPSLCREAKKLLDKGEKLPPEMKNLGGITRLQYVFVYPETNDLVIAGPAEDPMSGGDEHRVLGASSGRPMLRLDDLAVCLRVLGPGQSPRAFGCSIDMPENGLQNVQAAAQRIGAVSGFNNKAVADKLRDAVGLQDVRFFGVPADTNAAYVCIEADYVLKRISHAKLKPPVNAVKSYIALMKSGDGMYSRWWFTPNYEAIRVSEDGLAYELRSKGLKVDCSSSQHNDAPAGPGAQKFADLVTENFEGMESGLPSFADLGNICDLTVLAAIIRRDELDRTTKGGLDWLLNPKGYKVEERPTPRQVEPLAATKVTGTTLNTCVGGVSIDADGVVKSRQKDGSFKSKVKRPTDSWMLRESKASEAGG